MWSRDSVDALVFEDRACQASWPEPDDARSGGAVRGDARAVAWGTVSIDAARCAEGRMTKPSRLDEIVSGVIEHETGCAALPSGLAVN